MITIEDMNELFKLISGHLRKDISCYAFGGNAMMYYGYKKATKDIDIVFKDKESRDEFIRAIKLLGYKKMSLLKIYLPELIKEENKPIMFTRDDERFDIFLKQVFQTRLSPGIKERIYGRFDFIQAENTLTVFCLGKHDILLMKAITKRAKDFDDIMMIVDKDKIDWKLITEEAIWQAERGDKWVLLDLEETMQRLKRHTLIKKEFFDKLHRAI